MKPNAKYRAALVSRNVSTVSEVRIPAHLRIVQPDLSGTGIRKGRAPQKVGLYGRTSMFYKTSATIDSRWDQTLGSQHG